MGQVAGGAGFGGRRMKRLAGEIALPMTAQTELPLGLGKQRRVVRTVRVVTARTLSDSGMLVTRRERLLLFRVALETQVRLLGLQFQGAD